MECLFHIQHLSIQVWHVVVKPCRPDPALGELPALRKMRPVSSNAGFLPPSFSEAYEMVLLLLFPQRPLKLLLLLFFNQLFCCVLLNSGLFYASYDLLWEVIYFFFYSWSRFHPHSGTDGQ